MNELQAFISKLINNQHLTDAEAEAAMRGVGRHCQHLSNLDYTKCSEAIEADGSGYVTDAQMEALLRTNG